MKVTSAKVLGTKSTKTIQPSNSDVVQKGLEVNKSVDSNKSVESNKSAVQNKTAESNKSVEAKPVSNKT